MLRMVRLVTSEVGTQTEVATQALCGVAQLPRREVHDQVIALAGLRRSAVHVVMHLVLSNEPGDRTCRLAAGSCKWSSSKCGYVPRALI